jgi:hypothetical protein
MVEQSYISEESFLTFTTPNEIAAVSSRKIVASNASRYGRRQRRKIVNVQPDAIVRSFLLWRNSFMQTRDHKRQSTSGNQLQAEIPQGVVELGRMLSSVPASMQPRPSLQQCKSITSHNLNLQASTVMLELVTE